MPSAVVVRRRARSRSPPGVFDSARRTRQRLEEARRGGDAGAASVLPDDVLLEVFKRHPPPTAVVRCAAVCRRWRRVVSGAGRLPAPPRHLGFFRNYSASSLPTFVPTAGVGLDLGFLPSMLPVWGGRLVDCRGHRLVLRQYGPGWATELRLFVCNPLEKTFVRLPFLPVAGQRLGCCAVVPGEAAAFRVVVLLFRETSPNFHVLIYSSVSSAWEAAIGVLKRPPMSYQGPSVVIGDVVYNLLSDDKYIIGINMTTMPPSIVRLPDVQTLLYPSNNWIGKTEDGRLCLFVLQEELHLVTWVLEAPRRWTRQEPVALRQLMDVDTARELVGVKPSAKTAPDQLGGCRRVSIAGFCERSGVLFFIMDDWVVALDPKMLKVERVWRNDDKLRHLVDVFPYEMVAWPPALKDFAGAPLLDEA